MSKRVGVGRKGKRQGDWGRSLCCRVAWQGGEGGAGLRASFLWPDRAPQRACSQAKGGGSLGTELITGTYLLVGKMNSREEGFKKAFVEGMDYESATQSDWKTKEGEAINLSLVWLLWNRLKIKRYEVYW